MLEFAVSNYAALLNLLVGAVGLIVGVGGFWITLVQLSRVKGVAEAQKTAIRDLKFRMAGFDAIQECAQAQIYLNAVRDSIQKPDRPAAIANYDRFALCLINLAESGYVSDQISDELREGSSRISLLTSGLEVNAEKQGSHVSKQLNASRFFHGLLMKTRFYIQKDQ